MVQKMTVSVPTQYASEGIFLRPIAVSLPKPPFDLTITYNDRPETRPRSAPIRVTNNAKPTSAENSNLRKIWDYGQAVGFECTLAEVADAVGISLSAANAAAAKGGITSRFAKARPNMSKSMYGVEQKGASMRNAIGNKKRGRNVDENLLPLDLLIR